MGWSRSTRTPGKPVATVRSEDARLAARAAVDLSRETGSELHLVRVLDRLSLNTYPGVTPEVYAFVQEKQEREGWKVLAEESERVRKNREETPRPT